MLLPSLLIFFTTCFLTGNCQCFNDTVCTGDTIDVTEAGSPIADQADCCVGTNAGLSYNVGSTCNLCIGMSVRCLEQLHWLTTLFLCTVHGFAQAAYDVVEDERLDTRFQFNVKGTTQFGGLVVTGVITATADGTAGRLFTQTITFVASSSSPQKHLCPHSWFWLWTANTNPSHKQCRDQTLCCQWWDYSGIRW